MKSKKMQKIFEMVKNSGSKGILQPELVTTFVNSNDYKNRSSARVSINVGLLRMEAEGIVTKKKELNEGAGGHMCNRWFAK